MINNALANRYARALFDAALESGAEEIIDRQLQAVMDEMAVNEDFRRLLLDAAMPPRIKKEFFSEAFTGKLHPYLLHFFYIIIDNDREQQLEQAAVSYRQLLFRHQGILPVQVKTAVPLTKQQLDTLEEELKPFSDCKLLLTQELQPAVLGGMVVRMGDLVIDGSLRHRLEKLGRQMVEAQHHLLAQKAQQRSSLPAED